MAPTVRLISRHNALQPQERAAMRAENSAALPAALLADRAQEDLAAAIPTAALPRAHRPAPTAMSHLHSQLLSAQRTIADASRSGRGQGSVPRLRPAPQRFLHRCHCRRRPRVYRGLHGRAGIPLPAHPRLDSRTQKTALAAPIARQNRPSGILFRLQDHDWSS